MPILIDTNIRGTINEGVNLNQGRDISDTGAGHVTNIQGFVDQTEQLDLSIAGGVITLKSGAAFVRYQKLEVGNQNADIFHYMKCELTVPYTAPTPQANYFVWIMLNNTIITTSSNEVDGKDYFQIEYGANLPVTGDFLPLYQVVGTTITDLRVKRDACFENIEIEGLVTAGTISAGIVNATTANLTNIVSGAISLGGNDLQTTINTINTGLGLAAQIATTAEATLGAINTKAVGAKDAKDLYENLYTEISGVRGTTGTESIPHGLDRVPKKIVVYGYTDADTDRPFHGIWQQGTQRGIWILNNGQQHRNNAFAGGNSALIGTITSVGPNNINITWSGGPDQSRYTMFVEA